MRYILIILLLSSCYTKKQAINKFCSTDSVSVTIHDTILTQTITTDTFFSAKLDTVYINKGKLSIKYIKLHDSIYISGECQGDKIYLTREIKAPCKTRSASSFTFNEWIKEQPFYIVSLFMICFIFAMLYLFELLVNSYNRYKSR